MASVKDVFDAAGKELKIDNALCARIHKYERGIALKNEAHIGFLGGHLLGTPPFRFTPQDRDLWFEEVLQMDDLQLEDDVKALPTINANWKRASDIMNLSCFWLTYRLAHANLPEKVRRQAALEVMLIFQYKLLGSLMAHYYPYPPDEEVMLAMYASLSRKYALKVAGSWNKLLQERAEQSLRPGSVFYHALVNFTPDKAVVDAVSDFQGRLREIVKSMTAVFYQMKDEGRRLSADHAFDEINGDVILKDRSSKFERYMRYASSILDDRNTWIKPEILEAVVGVLHTVPPGKLQDCLVWMYANRRQPKYGYIDTLLKETVIYAMDFLAELTRTQGRRVQVSELIGRLRSVYMASRMSDPTLLSCRDMSEKAVISATGLKNATTISALRTGLQCYIVLRVFAMEHYQGT
jgi:hypothetical protein